MELAISSQFDKVNKDFQKALENKNDNSNYNFYNVWQITSQIIDNIDYKRYLSNTDNQPNEFDISIIKECLVVYDQIQNKNYATGIRKTMSILEKLSTNGNNYVLPAFYLKNVKVKFTKDGFSIDNKGNINLLKFSENKLEIINEKDNIDTIYIIHNYSKIQPFLRFVKNGVKDENYDLIKTIDPNFDVIVSKIASYLNLDEMFVIELLKVQSIYNDNGSNQDKLAAFLKTSEYIYSDNKHSNKDIERIKYKYQDQLFKITAFFNDLLAAKSEQELANAIDSHALPPTSYKLKRKVAYSIDLNGYVGVQGSRLLTNGYTSLEQQYTVGITAPIGFAYTWSTKGSNPHNFGFTIDVVDLCNIVNHYLVSSTEEYGKDVHFSEVFSPSLSGIWGLRKTPFVLFGSVKFLPLKTSKSDDGRLINNKTFDATMFSIGVKIDIPLVNLWTKVHN